MQKIAQESKEEVIDMFKEACEQEKEWAEYLFRDGSMIGLN
jgi:ribonucleoside-diphosphate reductase beta chain